MRKRKNTGKLLSILLCLVMVMGMLPTAAQAEEWGKVPGSSGTNTYEKADIEVEIPITKTVEQGGNVAPGEVSFTFELLMRGNEDSEAKVLDTAEITTNGAGTTEHSLKFRVPGDLDGADGFGRNYIYLREKEGSAAGWTYSNALYRVNRNTQDGQTYTYTFDLYGNEGEGSTNGLNKAAFTNIYTGYEIPFTKTVKLGGNAAPGKQTFELEIFEIGNRNANEYSDVTYTASVETNGVKNYESKLLITGPEDQLEQFTCEGFYVREKNTKAANWEYSDAVWYVMPEYSESGTVQKLVVHPTKLEQTANGDYYEPAETTASKMTFTNTYTRSTSGGGGRSTGAAITANKTDAQGKALAGATFVLEDSRGREAYQATSNTSGTVRFTDVSSGTYTLLEKKAPEGYVLSNETYTLTVSGSRVTMNGKSYSPVTFVNRKAAELNRTDHFAFLVGYTDGTFGPERNMTRAEVTTMFARLLTDQIEADKTYSNTFSDMPKGYWAANYIGYMQQFGIITGYSDGSFRPDAPVTRAEFAAIASRFEKLTEGSKSFTDVSDTYWAARYINFAATRGWVTGYSDGTFKPENTITRAEVAAVTCRLLERSADQNYIRSHLNELRTFSDVTESHWAYWYAMEAANGHDYTKSGGSENWSRTYR